ncbi:MAG: response regulator [Cyanobacteria bacterium J06634_5]
MRILLIEDDEILTSVLVSALQQQRYSVDTVDDGRFGLEYAQSGSYDLLLIDVGLPRLDGISLCQQLRNEGNKTPILLMTAKDAPDEKIRGLDAGADDYLTKPLDIGELQARLRALLRRGEVSPTTVLEIGQLRLDPVSCDVSYADQPLKLTPKEYSLLELFLRNPTRVFSRGHIIEHLWTFDDPPLEDSVKAHIKGLRRRLKKAGAEGWIENVYGMGYKLSPKIDYEAIAKQQSSTEEPQPLAQKQSTSVSSTEQNSVEQEFQQAMAGLWQQHRGAMAERMDYLKQAQAALNQNTLSEDLRMAAAQASHKLAGVLGMFGQEEGTQIARRLEGMLTEKQPADDFKTISVMIAQLEGVLAAAEEDLGSARESRAIAPNATVTLLAVDDDPVFLSTLPPLLAPWGMSVTLLSDPQKFWETLTATNPDLLILDIEMPVLNGIELCQAIRSDDRDQGRWQSLPILFLTARENAAGDVFSAGADDYVVKPVVGPELITRISNRLERTRLLKTLSSRDAQTGLANQAQSQQELQQWMSAQQAYTFVLLKLVNLAEVNLVHGHSMGYQMLRSWGDRITIHLNERQLKDRRMPGAIASYWGNGEFVLGLPGLTVVEAEEAIAPLLKTFRQLIFTPATSSDTESKQALSAQAPSQRLQAQRLQVQRLQVQRFQAQYAVGLSHFPQQAATLMALYQKAHAAMTATPNIQPDGLAFKEK